MTINGKVYAPGLWYDTQQLPAEYEPKIPTYLIFSGGEGEYPDLHKWVRFPTAEDVQLHGWKWWMILQEVPV